MKYPLDLECSYEAARKGNIRMLKILHAKKCPWDVTTRSYASGEGHLGCLKYAHENGCPLSKTVCEYAMMDGHMSCIIYVVENNGIPVDEIQEVIRTSNMEYPETTGNVTPLLETYALTRR